MFFFKVTYRHILLCQKLRTFLNSEELPAVHHIKFLKDTFNTNGGGCSSVRKAACLYRCTTKQGRHFITPQRTRVRHCVPNFLLIENLHPSESLVSCYQYSSLRVTGDAKIKPSSSFCIGANGTTFLYYKIGRFRQRRQSQLLSEESSSYLGS